MPILSLRVRFQFPLESPRTPPALNQSRKTGVEVSNFQSSFHFDADTLRKQVPGRWPPTATGTAHRTPHCGGGRATDAQGAVRAIARVRQAGSEGGRKVGSGFRVPTLRVALLSAKRPVPAAKVGTRKSRCGTGATSLTLR